MSVTFVGVLRVRQFSSIGEESYAAGSRPEWTDDPTFCVDPIGEQFNYLYRQELILEQMERQTLSMVFLGSASLLG